MTRFLIILASACLLSGCGTTGTHILTNLQGCERHYDGVVSVGFGGGFSGTVQIVCPAVIKPADPLPEEPED